MFNSYTYQELFLRSPKEREFLSSFLAGSGITLDTLDCYVGIFDGQKLIGGGGYHNNVIKCVAILEAYRSEQLANGLISFLRDRLLEKGYQNMFVFTKPEYEKVFNSLAFFTVGRSKMAILLESDRKGIAKYCENLENFATNGTNGVVVANCNPFTLGHRYLIETAAKQVDRLHVILVSQEQPPFTFEERFELVKKGTADLSNVVVHKGAEYIISSATFPSYFIKDSSNVAVNQIHLDLDIFSNHIAPALKCNIRFVGSEPTDQATRQYNDIMCEVLPQKNIQVKVIERKDYNDSPISASIVRKLYSAGDLDGIKPLVPKTTYDFLKNVKR